MYQFLLFFTFFHFNVQIFFFNLISNRTVSIDVFPVPEDTLVHVMNVSIVDPDAEDVLGAMIEIILDARHGTVGLSTIDGLHFISYQDNFGNGRAGAPQLKLMESLKTVPKTLLSPPTLGTNSQNLRDSIGASLYRSIEFVRSSHLVFRCGLWHCNRALETLTYLPDSDYHGTDNITIFVDDMGNSGSIGGPRNDSQTIPIDVRSINDAPTWNAHDIISLSGENGYRKARQDTLQKMLIVDEDVTLGKQCSL